MCYLHNEGAGTSWHPGLANDFAEHPYLGREIMNRAPLVILLSALVASPISAAATDYELKLVPGNTHTGSFEGTIAPHLYFAAPSSIIVVMP
jgi:hypothetical protein